MLFNFGAYHTGVEIYGVELEFAHPNGFSISEVFSQSPGINQIKPRCSHLGKYRMTIPMGRTYFAPKDVKAIITELR